MSTREGFAGDIGVKKTEKKGFLHNAKGKIAATGLATALGLAGLGVLASQKTADNNPSPTQPGGVIIPDNSSEPTTISTPFPSEAPTSSPTEKPSPIPTESQLPTWVKDIPKSEWSINEVPLNDATKKIGRLLEYPTSDGLGSVISSQYPTIVAVEPNIENNSIWVALTQNGDELTKSTSVVNINGKDTNFYEFKGLTIWYQIDSNTQILKKNPEGSQVDTSFVGIGLDKIASHLKVGDTLYGTLSFLKDGPQDEINKKTLLEIKSSIGNRNLRDEKVFKMYAQIVALP